MGFAQGGKAVDWQKPIGPAGFRRVENLTTRIGAIGYIGPRAGVRPPFLGRKVAWLPDPVNEARAEKGELLTALNVPRAVQCKNSAESVRRLTGNVPENFIRYGI